ncbi:unnamed protein product [Pseudo-nitzschia multistriata]|uniref:HMA domain-containing protein n=1 Tax=Pseudo-nitzschia multistriata TaxID=183589 RepID=A0A448Z8G1_9STRA|nr:unnamed protein product [Pseudo-nitzschia multistriata]
MAHAKKEFIKENWLMEDFTFCQVIDEDKDDRPFEQEPLLDLEEGVGSSSSSSSSSNHNAGTGPIEAEAELQTEPMPVRRRGPSAPPVWSPVAPPLPKLPGGTAFPPGAMWCGACDDEAGETSSDTDSFSSRSGATTKGGALPTENGNGGEDRALLETAFRLAPAERRGDLSAAGGETSEAALRRAFESSSLVLRSLLSAIPGVRSVRVPPSGSADPDEIFVGHDASVHAESMRHALEKAGYFASVPVTRTVAATGTATGTATATTTTTAASNGDARAATAPGRALTKAEEFCWVRSSFDVEGVCCASEIPAIRKIVKPLKGVAVVNVNLTTKVVYIQHNCKVIHAPAIAKTLTGQGFPARIVRDGASSVRFATGNRNTGVNVNSTGSGTHTENGTASPSNDAAVAEFLDRIGKSNYVESTLALGGLTRRHQVRAIETAVSKAFLRFQVRAVYPSAVSETIKVEHDPNLVSAREIRDFLEEHAGNSNHRKRDGSPPFPLGARISLDGGEAGLYLPSEDEDPNGPASLPEGGCLARMKSHHANVWLSGVFWILSMVGILGTMDRFKYFGLASVFFGLPPILVKAYRTLRRRQFDANCMMVTAALGALLLGEFDEAASVSFLFAVSEFLEARAARKARRALGEICALRPDHANAIHPVSKEIVVVPADRLPPGSTISVRTGDKIAADGIVVEGSTSVDESSLTGESTPVHKTVGDEVSGGTINIGQTQLVVRTKTTAEDSAVSRLIRLVEEAQSNRSPTEMMVDSFARSYTPFVVGAAAIMCTIPWYFGTETGRMWTLRGLIIVVIACPCALTISTPVTYAAGLAATAKRGVIVKGGAKLEAMGSVDRVVFDKTGTLTRGQFSVTHLEVVGRSRTRRQMLELLSLVQDRASHPIAASLVRAAKSEGVRTPKQTAVSDHKILKGEGITARVDGKLQVYVGNQRLFERLGMLRGLSSEDKDAIEEWDDTGGTVGFIGIENDGIIGMFCAKDSVREEAGDALDELKEALIETYMCTGDSDTTARAVSKEVGIPGHRVQSRLLPEDKLRFVEGLRRPEPSKFGLCRKKKYVLFCGDGVNDAPALAAVDIGVSMGEGAAMALEMSDVTLMDSNLTKLPYVIKMGQRVLKTVKENIVISFAAKFAVVSLTLAGKMTLLYAIASDVGIMLLVTLNGMKLLPNDRFDLVPPKQSRRRGGTIASRLAKLKGLGKNAGFELVSMNNTDDEPPEDLRVAGIV